MNTFDPEKIKNEFEEHIKKAKQAHDDRRALINEALKPVAPKLHQLSEEIDNQFDATSQLIESLSRQSYSSTEVQKLRNELMKLNDSAKKHCDRYAPPRHRMEH